MVDYPKNIHAQHYFYELFFIGIDAIQAPNNYPYFC